MSCNRKDIYVQYLKGSYAVPQKIRVNKKEKRKALIEESTGWIVNWWDLVER